jgi:hypothetical protein
MSLIDLVLKIFMQKGLFCFQHIFGQEINHHNIHVLVLETYFVFCKIISYTIICLKCQCYLGFFNLGYFISIIIVCGSWKASKVTQIIK